jgi:hypothetical protein
MLEGFGLIPKIRDEGKEGRNKGKGKGNIMEQKRMM